VPPDWLLLAPLGTQTGVDGRGYRMDDPTPLLAAWDRRTADVPLDWEHATHIRAPVGLDAPAAGWIVDLQSRDDGIWGKIVWTEDGATAVRSRAYRYYSPAYLLDASGAVRAIASVALTNQPNLPLPALNRENIRENINMSIPHQLANVLNLTPSATDDDVINAIRTLQQDRETALHRANTPDLSIYVPRADYDVVLHRAVQAETMLRQMQEDQRECEINGLIDRGLSEARITPATVEYHRAQARTDGGIDRLRAFIDAAPVVVSESNHNGGSPHGDATLTAEQIAIAAAFGNSAEIIAKFGGR
jgi:phage I-like protein